MKSLHLTPTFGLCNRLRSIAFWKGYAEATGRGFSISWEPSIGFDNTPWGSLFASPITMGVVPSGSSSVDLNRWFPVTGQPEAEEPKPNPMGFFPPPSDPHSVFAEKHLHLLASSDYPNQEWAKFVGKQRQAEFYKSLTPASYLQGAVDHHKRLLGDQPLGLHIRGNDALTHPEHAKFYDSSGSFAKWHEAARRAVDQGRKIYLATDQQSIHHEFSDRYGDAVVSLRKQFFTTEFDQPKPGQDDAVVDLFSLALCSEIVGTSWSSFSKAANDIRKAKAGIHL